MSHIKKSVRVFLLVVTVSLVAACHGFGFNGAGGNKSSLVEFLYPNSNGYVETPEIPQLQLPLRVGIAFTPATQSGITGFTEAQKQELARNVRPGLPSWSLWTILKSSPPTIRAARAALQTSISCGNYSMSTSLCCCHMTRVFSLTMDCCL